MEAATTDIEILSIFSDRILQILSSCTQKTHDANTSQSIQQKNANNALSVGVRGKAYYSDSDSDEGGESSDSESSADGLRADIAATEQLLRVAQVAHTSSIASKSSSTIKPAINTVIKTKSKNKSKDELVKYIGLAPSVSLTIDVQQETKTALALKIPAVLLPSEEEEGNRYIADEKIISPVDKLYRLFKNLNKPMSKSNDKNLILILMLQSGRFAAGIFHKGNCIKHTTSTRYTIRKGQGGAQSSNDNSKGKAKSIGSQLRREGEVQLRQDVASALQEWKGLLGECALFFVSISKNLQKGFWEDANEILGGGGGGREGICNLYKKSPDVIGIPLDTGKPSYEGCCAVHEILTTCTLQRLDLKMIKMQQALYKQSLETITESNVDSGRQKETQEPPAQKVVAITPLTLLHKAAMECNLEELTSLLSIESEIDGIDIRAGPEEMTPLHLAAESNDAATGSECVYKLLVSGHANPCILDSRNRPPYFLASSEPIRNAFRKARSEIGEDMWKWTEDAKVGPPLSDEDVQRKKEKTLDKKKKQKQRQKERKAEEKAEDESMKKVEEEEEAKQRAEEEAKRVRAGLTPKNAGRAGEHLCDFCQKACKRKSQMFARLDFYYCSTDCAKKHQRELTAAAAAARFNL
jgi:hypothetical protein